MIRSEEFAGPSEVRRFRKEVEAVAALDHSNVVPIYEVGEHQGQPYYAMRTVEGHAIEGDGAKVSGEDGEGDEERHGDSAYSRWPMF